MNDEQTKTTSARCLLSMASEIVSAYVSNNVIPAANIPDLIQTVYKSLSEMEQVGDGSSRDTLKPAVAIRRSITPEYIICLEDGKKLKMLKRHLRTTYNMTPDQYRSKWGLPTDYPMVAPNYAAQRSEFARKIGLGRKSRVVA